jgi:alpha-galactosidase
MSFKIAFIGAGGIEFTRRLCLDLFKVPEFSNIDVALHDINAVNLEYGRQLLEKDIAANKLGVTLTSTLNRREALEGADYVVNATRIGGLDAFRQDVEIPLEYGIDQCVGDTLCAGGLMYGQRNIPCVLEFCKDVREVSASDALFLNYANPMAMNTWAAIEYGKVNTVGLCHGVQGSHILLADALGIPKQELTYVASGINHQTWFTHLEHNGHIFKTEEVVAALEKHETYSREEKVRIDVLKRFGFWSTESNGHLSEYLPWYRKRPEDIESWIGKDSWINGETGGYLRVCTEGWNWINTDFPHWLAQAGKPLKEVERSHEHGSYIIEALETGRPYRGHFNVKNGGTIPNLPSDCIVESTGYVDKTGLRLQQVEPLPLACAATCQASIDVQRMGMEAAVHEDLNLLKQAMLHDSLCGAVCTPEELWQLTDRMLVAQAEWLPQFTDEIPAAKERLAKEKDLRRPIEAAYKVAVRSPEEMKATQSKAVMSEGCFQTISDTQ